ncbi:flagellar hook protein FlgE [Rhizobium sp. C4]|uniref:flagellar hook protein FlgE n=1 Tax=Rhizobium sp. C4 TaxID=1349800 RepID=UPI001E5DBA3A|nr:flagellar hook protein FlgE [Rhizobium sp. C4]MCD2172716.1 flagellar hook protein FlgE [Rhizobium sp. C4]
MSLQGMMRTSTSGMNAQASRLSSISDNIANSATTGYKGSSVSFSDLVLSSTGGNYASGSVNAITSYAISEQGALTSTTSATDLAIKGSGFFVVKDSGGSIFLTRDGSFKIDSSGELVNSSGFTLMGYSSTDGSAAIVNGFSGLVPVKATQSGLQATASTAGIVNANLDSRATAVTTPVTPRDIGANPASTVNDVKYTSSTSVVTYDSLGNAVQLDLYYTKTADNTWQVTAFNHADANAGSGSFPYSSGPIESAAVNLVFDPTTGKLDPSSDKQISIPIPGGQTVTLDMSTTTQFAYKFGVSSAKVDGNAPSTISSVSIGQTGKISAVYANGTTKDLYQIVLAKVQSPDNLTPVSGNAFSLSDAAGTVVVGFGGDSNFGTINSNQLEQSNVDVATQLTDMIESQRSYTANSKAFQTASDLMDVLVNLKR